MVADIAVALDQLAGVDEVGRGCLAGPLVVAAVILPEGLIGLRDSKLLSRNRRQLLAAEIRRVATYSLSWISASRIDALGLTAALRLASVRALKPLLGQCQRIVLDGNYNFLAGQKGWPPVLTVVGADRLIPSVSAASIIAKVARDDYMATAGRRWPQYGFGRNVGYGTTEHLAALSKYGPCRLHRRSFNPLKVAVLSQREH